MPKYEMKKIEYNKPITKNYDDLKEMLKDKLAKLPKKNLKLNDRIIHKNNDLFADEVSLSIKYVELVDYEDSKSVEFVDYTDSKSVEFVHHKLHHINLEFIELLKKANLIQEKTNTSKVKSKNSQYPAFSKIGTTLSSSQKKPPKKELPVPVNKVSFRDPISVFSPPLSHASSPASSPASSRRSSAYGSA